LRQHPVEIGAKPVGQVFGLDRPAKPARMKAAGNPVTTLDPRHSFADRRDFAGTVGQRHHAYLGWAATVAFEDHQIAVVERARAHPHQDLFRPGSRVLARSQYDVVNAAKAVDVVGFHFSFAIELTRRSACNALPIHWQQVSRRIRLLSVDLELDPGKVREEDDAAPHTANALGVVGRWLAVPRGGLRGGSRN
jgi:hypothetical protein